MSFVHKNKRLKALLAEQFADPGQRPVRPPTRPRGDVKSTSLSPHRGGGGSCCNCNNVPVGADVDAPDATRPLDVMLHTCLELQRSYVSNGVALTDAERSSAQRLMAEILPHELQPAMQPLPPDVSASSPSARYQRFSRASSQPSPLEKAATPTTGLPADELTCLQAQLFEIIAQCSSIHHSAAQAAHDADAHCSFKAMEEQLARAVAHLVQARFSCSSTVYVLSSDGALAYNAELGAPSAVSVQKNALLRDALQQPTLITNRRTALAIPCVLFGDAGAGERSPIPSAAPASVPESAAPTVLGLLTITQAEDGLRTFPSALPVHMELSLKLVAKACATLLSHCNIQRRLGSALERMEALVNSFAIADVSEATTVEDLEMRLLSAARRSVKGEKAFVLRDVPTALAAGLGSTVPNYQHHLLRGLPAGLWQIASDAVQCDDVLAVDISSSSDYFLNASDARSVLAVPLRVRQVRKMLSPVLMDERSPSHTPQRHKSLSRDDMNAALASVADTPEETVPCLQSAVDNDSGSHESSGAAARVDVLLIINKKPPRGPAPSSSSSSLSAHQFTPQDKDVMRRFIGLIHPAMQVAEMWGDAEERADVLSRVLTVVRAVMDMDTLHPEDVATTIMAHARDLLHADVAQLYMVDKESSELTGVLDNGREVRVSTNCGICGACCRTQQLINVPNAQVDPRSDHRFEQETKVRPQSVLCCPVMRNGECLAVAVAINKRRAGAIAEFTSDDERLLGFVTVFIAFALHNSTLITLTTRSAREALQLNRHHGALSLHKRSQQTPCATSSDRVADHASVKTAPPADHAATNDLCTTVSEEVVCAIEAIDVDAALIEEFATKDFDIFALQRRYGEHAADLAIRLVVSLFQRSGLLKRFNCPPHTMARFVAACRAKYRPVIYHNFFHAVDVAQTLYTFIYDGGASKVLTDLQYFVLLITALVHDLDHMGLNNSFHLKTDSPLGILSSASGNESVLEVHHAALAIQILEDPLNDVFAGIEDTQRRDAYMWMIECVLATDMARHKQLTDKFIERFGSDAALGSLTAPLPDDAALLLMQVLMKAADISNVSKPFAISRQWAMAVTEEFYRQGDKERAKGVDVLPMFDRSLNTELAKGQLGFINFVALPYYECIVSSVFTGLRSAADRIEVNRSRWAAADAAATAEETE